MQRYLQPQEEIRRCWWSLLWPQFPLLAPDDLPWFGGPFQERTVRSNHVWLQARRAQPWKRCENRVHEQTSECRNSRNLPLQSLRKNCQSYQPWTSWSRTRSTSGCSEEQKKQKEKMISFGISFISVCYFLYPLIKNHFCSISLNKSLNTNWNKFEV